MIELRGEVERASKAIGEWFAEVYADLTSMSLACDRELQVARGMRTQLTERHLRAIQPVAATFLG